jgi:hypothetical protein
MILASATVEVITPNTPKKIGNFRVEVWGKAPYDYVRHYEIMAQSDTVAAQQGIARFVAEMEAMPEPPVQGS